jgi:hypothetical protein
MKNKVWKMCCGFIGQFIAKLIVKKDYKNIIS